MYQCFAYNMSHMGLDFEPQHRTITWTYYGTVRFLGQVNCQG
jgi:hypothetical protein